MTCYRGRVRGTRCALNMDEIQLFAVKFELVSVPTDALLDEAFRDNRLFLVDHTKMLVFLLVQNHTRMV